MGSASLTAPRLLHVFSNFVDSGPELRTVALMNAFGARYRHLVVSMDGRTSALAYVDPGIDLEVRQLPSVNGPLSAARGIWRLLHEVTPDLLLTYNWGAFDAVMASVPAGRRVIHHEDGFNADEAGRLKVRRVWARRLFFRFAHAVIVPSFTLERIARARWGLRPPRLQVIPNGVDPSRLVPAASVATIRRQLGIPEAAHVVGTVAHLRREKRLDRLVELLAWFPPERRPHAVVVGEGPERAALQELAQSRGVSEWLHLVGAHRSVGDFLQMLDAYLLTSETEQMPVSLLEAMCCALPVVATRVGDVAAILPADQRPFTVASGPEGDMIRLLGAAVQVLLQDQGQARRLGSANRDHVRAGYSFEAMARLYAAVYEGGLRSARPLHAVAEIS